MLPETGRRRALVGIVAASTLGLTACSEDTAGPETGTDVGDIQGEGGEARGPHDGEYDIDFYEDLESYADQEVTVSADVNEVVSPTAFTIAGTDDTTVEELLILGAEDTTVLEPEMTVAVTGTVHPEFVIEDVEQDLGVDLDDALFEVWFQEPYIVAESVDTSVPRDE
jgi:hypothetical protein